MDSDQYRTPGQLIDALLAECGWTKRVLATVLGFDETVVNKLITGRRAIDGFMALALGEVFNVDPNRFMELQASYDLAKARIETRPDPARVTRAKVYGALPVGEMIRRGWLNATDVRDVASVEKALTAFFGVSSVDEIEALPHAAKKTAVSTPATPVQLAWLYRVRQLAVDMVAGRYSPQAVRDGIERLRNLIWAAEEARKAPRILAESGIRFVIVESLPGAKIDGVCFWLNDMAPVIAMSMRYDRIDNFWFVLRHELEHVVRRHGRAAVMLDAELEGERAGEGPLIAEEERVANAAAAQFCVPQDALGRFISNKAPFFAGHDIRGFANTLKIHPGLVAGQLQRRLNRYDLFRQFQVKIRSIVAPGAIVDGWGDVAPVGM